MTFDKELRTLARKRNQYLVAIVLDGGERDPADNAFSFMGPVPDECFKELNQLLIRWLSEGKV